MTVGEEMKARLQACGGEEIRYYQIRTSGKYGIVRVYIDEEQKIQRSYYMLDYQNQPRVSTQLLGIFMGFDDSEPSDSPFSMGNTEIMDRAAEISEESFFSKSGADKEMVLDVIRGKIVLEPDYEEQRLYRDRLAILRRHSVRKYKDQRIEAEIVKKLQEFIDNCNKEGNLHFQFCEDAGNTYHRLMNRAMGLGSAPSVIGCVGPVDDTLEERIGYYGEQIVLYAQQLGLNTCWVGTFNRNNIPVEILEGEKLVISIAIGYGQNQGKERKSKSWFDVTSGYHSFPKWYKYGAELALLAPTALNQQKFDIRLHEEQNDAVTFHDKGGIMGKVDLGIVMCHFEIGAKIENREFQLQKPWEVREE